MSETLLIRLLTDLGFDLFSRKETGLFLLALGSDQDNILKTNEILFNNRPILGQ